MPEPPQRGQVLSRDSRIAFLMNSERFDIPRIASTKAASALNVMTSSLFFMDGLRELYAVFLTGVTL